MAACASYQSGDNDELSGGEAAGQSQKAVVDMWGFSGYGWGTSIEYITASMQDEDYDLIASGDRDLWYRGKILGEKLQLVVWAA